MSCKEYNAIKRKAVLDYLEKYPTTPSRTLARMLKRDFSELFKDIEDARGQIRSYRGVSGKRAREAIKFTKFFKDV